LLRLKANRDIVSQSGLKTSVDVTTSGVRGTIAEFITHFSTIILYF
jgi:hypothetical protein